VASLPSKAEKVTADFGKPHASKRAQRAAKIRGNGPKLPLPEFVLAAGNSPPVWKNNYGKVLPTRGQIITFSYPIQNRHGRCLLLKRPTVRVLEVQDAEVIPITLDQFNRRPQERRGRWRMRAWDPSVMGIRIFHLDWDDPKPLQVGLYDPLDIAAGYTPIESPFQPTPEDLRDLHGLIGELLKDPLSLNNPRTLGLFAVPGDAP
jgi:hypothetical protein